MNHEDSGVLSLVLLAPPSQQADFAMPNYEYVVVNLGVLCWVGVSRGTLI